MIFIVMGGPFRLPWSAPSSSITAAAVGGIMLNVEREPTVVNELTNELTRGMPGH